MTLMSLDYAERVAAEILAEIDSESRLSPGGVPWRWTEHGVADRDRVGSDLAGLRECWENGVVPMLHVLHAARYEAGLRRTAALYGVSVAPA